MKEEDQAKLMQRLQREHAETPHPDVEGGRLRLHLAVHAVVEGQLAEGRPATVERTLARLLAEGLSHHDAVHAIGVVAAEEVVVCLSDPERTYDEARYSARLEAIDPAALTGEDPTEGER
jgi:hypothetical protein